MHAQAIEVNELTTQLSSVREQLKDAKLRNTRCEEIIREMREKLSTKLKECDQQNRMIEQSHGEIKRLLDLKERVSEKLFVVEESNTNNEEEISNLRRDVAKKQEEIERFESQLEDLKENVNSLTLEKKYQQEKV